MAQIARDRLSTVYIPGHKLTMLPDAVVDAFTLAEGRDAAVVSLYVTLDEATLATLASETRLERVRIAANLRHDRPRRPRSTRRRSPPACRRRYRSPPSSTFLHGLAQHLKARREQVRGKPENFNRPDYSFRLDLATATAPIVGDERGRDRAAPARLAARPDRRRGDDPRQQHLGRLARRPAACPASTAARRASRRA